MRRFFLLLGFFFGFGRIIERIWRTRRFFLLLHSRRSSEGIRSALFLLTFRWIVERIRRMRSFLFLWFFFGWLFDFDFIAIQQNELTSVISTRRFAVLRVRSSPFGRKLSATNHAYEIWILIVLFFGEFSEAAADAHSRALNE